MIRRASACPYLLCCLWILGSCGSAQDTSTGSASPSPASASAPAHARIDAGNASIEVQPDAPPLQNSDSARLTQLECEALLSHAFDLEYQARAAEQPNHLPPPEEIRAAREAATLKLLPDCIGANRRQYNFECVMAAQTQDSLLACGR